MKCETSAGPAEPGHDVWASEIAQWRMDETTPRDKREEDLFAIRERRWTYEKGQLQRNDTRAASSCGIQEVER